MSWNTKRPGRETFAEWVEQGLTSMDVQARTGASAATVCRWSQSFNLELARAEWGGNRKQEYVRPVQLDLEIRELPLPATGGRLSYWQQMGEWMMGGEYAA